MGNKNTSSGAQKRNSSGFEVIDAATAKSALFRIGEGEKRLLIIDRYGIQDPPITKISLSICPLSLADIRRTIFLIHPKRKDLAEKSISLHRLTGGIPALLTPLLHKKKLIEPSESKTFHAAINTTLEGLNYEAFELIATMGILNSPAAVEELENISLAPVNELFPELIERGIVEDLGFGYWRLRATAIAEAARARLPEEESLLQRCDVFREEPLPIETIKRSLFEADVLVAQGLFNQGLTESERAIVEAYRSKDAHIIGEANLRRGSLLLDLGQFKHASKYLSDLSVWTKGHGLQELKKRSHAMRARGSLEMQPGSRASATSAVNRIAELLHNNTDPVISCMWAWAIAALGDERGWKKSSGKKQHGIYQRILLNWSL